MLLDDIKTISFEPSDQSLPTTLAICADDHSILVERNDPIDISRADAPATPPQSRTSNSPSADFSDDDEDNLITDL